MIDILKTAVDWLNSNSGAITGIAAIITAIATVVLVGITGFYAWVTKKMLEENRQMRLDAQKPRIAIFLRPHESSIRFIVLCIQNMGGGPAKNVQFTCTSDAILSPLFIGYIKHGISYFAPSQKIEDIIMDVHGQSAEVMQTPVEITGRFLTRNGLCAPASASASPSPRTLTQYNTCLYRSPHSPNPFT